MTAKHLFTLFGVPKEFSSLRLSDVSMVLRDPNAAMPLFNPDIEILRFTISLPKLTTCIKKFATVRKCYFTKLKSIAGSSHVKGKLHENNGYHSYHILCVRALMHLYIHAHK